MSPERRRHMPDQDTQPNPEDEFKVFPVNEHGEIEEPLSGESIESLDKNQESEREARAKVLDSLLEDHDEAESRISDSYSLPEGMDASILPEGRGDRIRRTERAAKTRIEQQMYKTLEPDRRTLIDKISSSTELPSRSDVYAAFPFDKVSVRTVEDFAVGWSELNKHGDNGNAVFEILTKEYIAALAESIDAEVQRIRGKDNQPITILEVGAGNGKLYRSLKSSIESENVTIVAVDNGDWEQIGHHNVNVAEDVEKINHTEALAKYSPQIVICSWMDPSVDLSKDFRESESVESYVLVGDPRVTGTGETWGRNSDPEKKIIGELGDFNRDEEDRLAVDRFEALRYQESMKQEPVFIDKFQAYIADDAVIDSQVSLSRYSDYGEPSATYFFRRS